MEKVAKKTKFLNRFLKKKRVLNYIPKIFRTAHSSTFQTCSRHPGFLGIPDVQNQELRKFTQGNLFTGERTTIFLIRDTLHFLSISSSLPF